MPAAARRDIVCDLSNYAGRSLYLYNQPDPARTTSTTPFFCYSHLVMKMNVGAKGPAPAVQPKMVFGPDEGFLETNVALNSTYLQVAQPPLLLLALLIALLRSTQVCQAAALCAGGILRCHVSEHLPSQWWSDHSNFRSCGPPGNC
jgi:hypothetical protein